MTELKKMANSIHPMIQLDEDHQHNHHDRKLPILDLKVWVSGDESGNQRLRWQYYRKPMANWLLLPAESAMSMATKRTTLTQYGLRILRNTSLEISWDVKAEMLSEFCERMRDSGYNQKFRAQVTDSILKGWDKMVEQQRKGGRPINRPKSYEEAKRKQQKSQKQRNWFKTGGYTSVMFCPWTPGGELAKRWRQVERQGATNRGWRYKVIELSGRPVSSILCSNPWSGPCSDETCFICSTGGSGSCGRTGCNYVVTCLTCRDTGPSTVPNDREEQNERQTKKIIVGQPAISKYYGESGYSGNVRGGDHHIGMDRKDRSNALYRHCLLYHGGQKAEFTMSVLSNTNKPYIRRIEEGVRIVAGDQDV